MTTRTHSTPWISRLLATLLTLLAAPPSAGAFDLAGRDAQQEGSFAPVNPTASAFSILVNNENITAICPDEAILDWGYVYDAEGSLRANELWLVVVREERNVYLHLVGTPATGRGTACGYVLKAKATTRLEFFNYGSGAEVIGIGNEEDAFLVASTELRVNPLFTPGHIAVDLATGEPITSPKLEFVGESVLARSFPTSTSEGFQIGIHVVHPDGSTEDFGNETQYASNADDCEQFGEDYASLPEAGLDILDAALEVLNPIGIDFTSQALGSLMGPVGAAALDAATSVAGDNYADLHQAVFNSLDAAVLPAAQVIGTKMCVQAEDIFAGAPLNLESSDFAPSSLVDGEVVCDAWITIEVDGEFTLDESGEIAEYVTETIFIDICVRSHVEYY